MTYVYAILLIFLNLAWLLLNLLGLPGNWLMVVTVAIVLWVQWDAPARMFSIGVLVAMTALAGLGEILELTAGALGARQAGASRRASIGALVAGVGGAVAGTFLIPIPVVGSIVGACLGASLAALGLEYSGGRSLEESVRSGLGAGKGRLLGTLVKLAVGLVIWTIAAGAAFWP